MEEPLHGNSLSASLTVKDIERSLAWYRDVMGFAVHEKHERNGNLIAVSLRAGEAKILLARDDGAKGLDRAKGDGFSMMITTNQDIDGVAARLRERGVTFDTEPSDSPFGTRFFRLRDPDGFRFTISSERR